MDSLDWIHFPSMTEARRLTTPPRSPRSAPKRAECEEMTSVCFLFQKNRVLSRHLSPRDEPLIIIPRLGARTTAKHAANHEHLPVRFIKRFGYRRSSAGNVTELRRLRRGRLVVRCLPTVAKCGARLLFSKKRTRVLTLLTPPGRDGIALVHAVMTSCILFLSKSLHVSLTWKKKWFEKIVNPRPRRRGVTSRAATRRVE